MNALDGMFDRVWNAIRTFSHFGYKCRQQKTPVTVITGVGGEIYISLYRLPQSLGFTLMSSTSKIKAA